MDLLKMIDPECCKANISGTTKNEILEKLTDLVMKHPAAGNVDRAELLKRIHEREEKGSTGIGNQLAIPHAEISGLEDFIVIIATSQRGVDFEAIDNKRARLFFMILAPEGEAANHLKILAMISRTLSLPGVRAGMLASPTETALYESFATHVRPEGEPPQAEKKEDMSLLSLILFDIDLIYDILEMFLEKGIEGANITESSGMGEYISSVPLFAGFLGFMNDRTNRSKTIQALIPSSRIRDVVEGIESITGDLDKKQGAALFISPVSLWKGSMKMM
jgi:nitrogen PTS system EIIA component